MLVERMVSERGLRDVEGRPLREGARRQSS